MRFRSCLLTSCFFLSLALASARTDTCDETNLCNLTAENIGTALAPKHAKLLRETIEDVQHFHEDITLILVVTTQDVICLFDNWLVHLRRTTFNESKAILNIALDERSFIACMVYMGDILAETTEKDKFICNLYCLDFRAWIPFDTYNHPTGGINFVDMRRDSLDNQVLRAIIWSRPLLLLHVANIASSGVLYLDLDVIVTGSMSNILEYVENHREDGVTLFTGAEPESALNYRVNNWWNCGSILADKASVPLLREWILESSRCRDDADLCPLGDQSALGHLLARDATLAAKVQRLPIQLIRQMADPLPRWFAVHYNHPPKIPLMHYQGHWNPSHPLCKKGFEIFGLPPL